MRISLLVVLAAVALAACGDDESTSAGPSKSGPSVADPPNAAPSANKAAGTRVTVRQSDYGRMLWGPGRQAIYIFENDEPARSRCYGECAAAWPPVFAKGAPMAGKGVQEDLLGTTKRRNGKRQVTYNGKPLYYYAHEGPDEVLCHDVFLNGGYWWVIGPNGKRRP
jgi:predicted lipoprotein with Yx(FWY)xxD motif